MFKTFIPSERRMLFFATLVFAPVAPVGAQENALPPSEVLETPFEANDQARDMVNSSVTRFFIQRTADTQLCNILMENRYKDDPDELDALREEFGPDHCESDLNNDVQNNQGLVHWKNETRPLTCGTSCFGRPFMTSTSYLDRPNLRQAKIFGRLNFVIDLPTIDRDLTIPYEIVMTCKAVGGSRVGVFDAAINLGDPILGGAGWFETALDFFLLPANISRRLEAAMKSRIPNLPSASLTDADNGAPVEPAPCTSIGVLQDQNNPLFDVVRINEPSDSILSRARLAAVTAITGDRARIEFISIKRNRAPSFIVDDPQASGDASGVFFAYLNGAGLNIPPPSAAGQNELELPVEGGTVSLNYCRTIDLSGRDKLQMLFVNGLGGAVWSQFSKSEKFGEGEVRRMTTGRTIVRPAMQGPPDPVTGRPTFNKPTTQIIREFELFYRIVFLPQPGMVSTDSVGAGAAGGTTTGGAGSVASAVITERPQVTDVIIDPDRPLPQSCREI